MTISRRTLPMIVAVGVLLASCGDNTSPAGDGTPSADDTTPDVTLPAPDDSRDAANGSWSLTSGTVDDAPLALIDGWDVTLVVERGEVAGRAACNGYGGLVDVGDGTFRVSELSWTEMGCEPSVMELEQAFLRGLSAVTSFATASGVLTLSGPNVELAFEPLAPVPDSEIVGTTWVLDTYIDGEAASNMPMMERATLTLNADGTLTGSTSCRQLTGMWITTGATIQFTSFSAIDDPAAGVCAPESQTLDGLVISVLESGFTVEVDGDRMTLMAPGNEGLSYTANPSPGGDDAESAAEFDPAGGVDGPVAYAGYDPTAPSDRQTSATVMLALIDGALELDGDCLFVARPLGRVPVLWPFGTTWQTDPPAVILPNGDVIAVGGQVTGGGGYIDLDGLGSFSSSGELAFELADRCVDAPSREVAVLQSF